MVIVGMAATMVIVDMADTGLPQQSLVVLLDMA
jgi:hypothetical protein